MPRKPSHLHPRPAPTSAVKTCVSAFMSTAEVDQLDTLARKHRLSRSAMLRKLITDAAKATT